MVESLILLTVAALYWPKSHFYECAGNDVASFIKIRDNAVKKIVVDFLLLAMSIITNHL